jgi:hypothetical protein
VLKKLLSHDNLNYSFRNNGNIRFSLLHRFVECGGIKTKCDLRDYSKLTGRFKGGLRRSIGYLQKKLFEKQELLKEINELTSTIN